MAELCLHTEELHSAAAAPVYWTLNEAARGDNGASLSSASQLSMDRWLQSRVIDGDGVNADIWYDREGAV